jgi:hypothetical protein
MPDSAAVNDGFVDIPGVRLANDISGREPSILFLNGGLFDCRICDDQEERTCKWLQPNVRASGQCEPWSTRRQRKIVSKNAVSMSNFSRSIRRYGRGVVGSD